MDKYRTNNLAIWSHCSYSLTNTHSNSLWIVSTVFLLLLLVSNTLNSLTSPTFPIPPALTHFIYHKHKHFLIHAFSCWAHVGKSLIEVVNFDGGGVANSTHSLWLLSQPPTPSLLLRSTLSVFLPSPFLSFSVCLLSSSQQICHLSVCRRRCLLHLSTNGHYAQE